VQGDSRRTLLRFVSSFDIDLWAERVFSTMISLISVMLMKRSHIAVARSSFSPR
jgi:hypothetical protein